MNLSELNAICDRAELSLHRAREEDPKVVISTAVGGVPINRMVEVRSAMAGGDWTSGLFVLYPAEPIVVARILSEPICDLARRRLDQIIEAHQRLGFKYIPATRKDDWVQGFIEGVRAHVTSCTEDAGDDHAA